MPKVRKKDRKPSSRFTIAEKYGELFRRGVIAPWTLHSGQMDIYNAIHASTEQTFVINVARRFGKSYLLAVLALEKALSMPAADVKYATSGQKMSRKIVLPIFRHLLANCPEELKPRFVTMDGEFRFYNDSIITVAGTDNAQIDNLRGTSCNLALLDECGFMDDPTYVVESVLAPQTLTCPDAKIILASTPPISPDHPFSSHYIQEALTTGAYYHATIHQNPMLTPEIIARYCKRAGGESSSVWRREYLAEIITETENALFPEATDELMSEIVVDIPRPQHFFPITVMDLGYVDFTGALLGYFDFMRGKIVIEDEILVKKSTSAEIVKQVLEKEKALWGNVVPRSRIVDGNALAIADLNSTHRFACRAPSKADLEANVNRVRIDLNNQAILINPRCTNLISQVKFATWDSSRSKFSRSSSGGHWDLCAALIYLCKHIDRRSNPVPFGYGYDPQNQFGLGSLKNESDAEQFKAMFPFLVRK